MTTKAKTSTKNDGPDVEENANQIDLAHEIGKKIFGEAVEPSVVYGLHELLVEFYDDGEEDKFEEELLVAREHVKRRFGEAASKVPDNVLTEFHTLYEIDFE